VPRYAPLPVVSIDPRNEAELVQEASQRVYDASNQTLNDFSSGNPLAALIEGQAFAQGEFLFWANQLPEKILLEWIGPFLGAMRRLGTPSIAQLTLTIPPSDSPVFIPVGSTFATDPNATGGESISFVTTTDVTIPPGQISTTISVASQFVGREYNVPAQSITDSSFLTIPGATVTNRLPAVGGSDVESYDDVRERFFTLIRRKNPVSGEDWSDFFEDLYGVGTLTSIQPGRPSRLPYNYETDYKRSNGQVSFFVLGPGGIELTPEQLRVGQNVLNFSTPVELEAHLYPISLSDVQYNLTVEIDATGAFGGDTKTASNDFRNRLNNILIPGRVFPADIDPTVGEIDSAFYSTFDAVDRYKNPGIVTSAAFTTPAELTPEAATYTQVLPFETSDFLLNPRDLVYVSQPVKTYYAVTSPFTPTSAEKSKQTIYDNLVLKQIKYLTPGLFAQGDVVFWSPEVDGDAELHVVLQNVAISSYVEIPQLIQSGLISGAKSYSEWKVGLIYSDTVNDIYDPQIIQYTYSSDEYIPPASNTSQPVPQEKRPGTLVWLVAKEFILEQPTDDLTGASSAGVLSPSPVEVKMFRKNQTFSEGDWVMTPQIGSGPNPIADPYYNYIDLEKGVVNKYAYVNSNFTFVLRDGETLSDYFDDLVAKKVLKEIIVQNADKGLPLARYNARFQTGQYLEYRRNTKDKPVYYISAQYFTPFVNDPDQLVREGFIVPLATSETQENDLQQQITNGSVKQPSRMFTFFKGDRTFFRDGVNITSYTATENVSPLFAFRIYEQSGIFVKTETMQNVSFNSTEYIPFFNPAYAKNAEDSIYEEQTGSLYRVIKSFTPKQMVRNWTEATVENTPRNEEYAKNLLRYVNMYSCEDPILSQLGKVTSAIKLGVAQITIIPKSKKDRSGSNENLLYVWEATESYTQNSELSWYPGTRYPFTPPNYGPGTLAL
jgi:hypothetical protein